MSSVTSVKVPSVTLAALKADNKNVGGNESDAEETSTMIVSGTRQVSADTTVTTLVMTSTDSRLPNLSLEDVLERSGVDDNAVVMLESEVDGEPQGHGSESMAQTVIVESSDEQIQNAIDSLEGADAVVVEVETTNNVQTVTVRAADIDTVYTQATVQGAGNTNQRQSNYLLLRNGWAYTDLKASPLDLPVGPVEQAAGNGWAIWRSVEGGVHEIQDAVTGLWNRLAGLEVDISPKTPADVAGVLSFHTADAQIASTTTTTTTLQLSPEGVFTNTRSSLTTSGNLLPDVSFALHTISSATGKRSNFSGTSQLAGSQTAAVSSQQQLADLAGDMLGAYRVLEDGMTLEMHFADGSVVRRLYLQAKENEENLVVGGQRYFRQRAVDNDLLGNLMRMLTKSGLGADQRGQWLKGMADAMCNSAKRPDAAPVGEQLMSKNSLPMKDVESLPEIHHSAIFGK